MLTGQKWNSGGQGLSTLVYPASITLLGRIISAWESHSWPYESLIFAPTHVTVHSWRKFQNRSSLDGSVLGPKPAVRSINQSNGKEPFVAAALSECLFHVQLRAQGHDARYSRNAPARVWREGPGVGGVPGAPQEEQPVARGGVLDPCRSISPSLDALVSSSPCLEGHGFVTCFKHSSGGALRFGMRHGSMSSPLLQGD